MVRLNGSQMRQRLAKMMNESGRQDQRHEREEKARE